MSLVGYGAKNHPQQVAARGADQDGDDRATDPVFFDVLNERFGFTLDVAAAAHNTKCERFFDREQDGLQQGWGGRQCGVTRPTPRSGRGSRRRGSPRRCVRSS